MTVGTGRVRAGLVGAGHMGQYHGRVYAELWDVDLVGIVDADPARAAAIAAQYDTAAFDDHRALIGRVDVASVAVPTEQHFDVARDLLEAGISVLVEKPITPTLDEARELYAIARRAGTALEVGHVERFNGAVQELRKIVERPILIESRRLGPFVPRVQKDTVVMDLMIHDIDIVLALVPSEPVRLSAFGATVHSDTTDVATVQIAFASGAVAAAVPEVCGCAFCSDGGPWVAQRVWPMPVVPRSGLLCTRSWSAWSLPAARRTATRWPSCTASPALS